MSLYPEKNKKTFFPDAAVSDKFLLGKAGSDQNHVAVIAAQTDIPTCVIEDGTTRSGATVLDVPVKCEPLTGNPELLWCKARGACVDGEALLSYGNGQVIGYAAAASGNYYQVGVVYGDSATGSATIADADGVHFAPMVPVAITKP